MIRINDFSYRYRGSNVDTLQNINLEINKGEFVLLTGPSGCGKSTLALALAGFLFSQSEGVYQGVITIAGLDPGQEPIYQLADQVGLVQQNPENQFCTLMVEDEIAFGLENRRIPREEIEQRLTWSLEAASASHLRDRELISLSGGEKQKIALAAILAARPRVIIFDEPTSNLDPPATGEIFDIILDLQRTTSLTVLVIEHKLDFLNRAGPRLIEMSPDGSILLNPSEKEELDFSPPEYKPAVGSSLLEVDDLTLAYDGRTVLSDVGFNLVPGELVSLLGGNGSGKSSLLLSVMNLIRRDRGLIRVLGQDLDQYDSKSLGRIIGLVFQNPDHQIFAGSVWEEAVMAPKNFQLDPDDYQDRANFLLGKMGLGGRIDDHPYRLSYGEKRRLNLVSVLTSQPRILLLDEIFIGQDKKNAHFLLQLLIDYVEEGNAVVMVNHNPFYYSRVCTRLMFLKDGGLALDQPMREGLIALRDLGQTAYLPGGEL